MNSVRVAVIGLTLLATGCQLPPRDSYATAERALLRHDLPSALQAFDAVPVAHARYPEARAAAAGVERRMRRSHEHLLEGLLLRSEWRDREALVALRRAKEIWTALPGVDVLIRATEHRIGLFAGSASPEVPSAIAPIVPVAAVAVPSAAPSEPVAGAAPEPAALPAEPADPVRLPESAPVANPIGVTDAPGPSSEAPQLERQPQVQPRLAEVTQSATPAGRDEGVGAGLMRVEARLGSGDLEGAVAELFSLAGRYPGEVRIRLRLVRVLHQRALLRYGQGALAAAIVDWERVAELDPQHAVARNLLAAARAEAGVGVQPSPGR